MKHMFENINPVGGYSRRTQELMFENITPLDGVPVDGHKNIMV